MWGAVKTPGRGHLNSSFPAGGLFTTNLKSFVEKRGVPPHRQIHPCSSLALHGEWGFYTQGHRPTYTPLEPSACLHTYPFISDPWLGPQGPHLTTFLSLLYGSSQLS